jgi:hypothetical protein
VSDTWVNVSSHSPCPVCGHDSWCSVSEDGGAVVCRRNPSHPDFGEGEERTDKDGSTYWFYRLRPSANGEAGQAGQAEWPAPKFKPSDGGGKLADADTLYQVHTALLKCSELQLHGRHCEALYKRGLPQSAIESNKYRTLAGGRRWACHALVEAGLEPLFPGVPGFVHVTGNDGRPCWSIAGPPGILIPCRDAQGRIVALMVRADEPGDDGGKYKFVSSRGKKHGGPGPGAPIHNPLFSGDKKRSRVTEGWLKADILTARTGTFTLGLPGAKAPRQLVALLRELAVETVVIAFDSDCHRKPEVAGALAKLVDLLRAENFAVELETWDEADGKGLDDVWAAGKQANVKLLAGGAVAEEVAAIVVAAAAAGPGPAGGGKKDAPPASGTPIIQANRRQLPAITADALRALLAANDPPSLFQRGDVLTRLRAKSDTGAPCLETLDADAVRGLMARAAWWGKGGGKDMVDCPPPMDVVKDLMALPGWDGVPVVDSVAECPVFGPDGELVVSPGYHAKARLWHSPAAGLDVPPVYERPSREDVDRAKALLLVELLGDFPFADEASRAHAIAALLLPFVRRMIDGPTPLHLFDAPVEGTGKTLLVNCVTAVATGRQSEAFTEASCPDEWRKRLTAGLEEGGPFMVIDNLNRVLDTGALASVLTARVWRDRKLGFTKMLALPNAATWLASGNNTRLSREMIRRTVFCRLDAKVDAPWERTGFRHPNLPKWTRDNRGQLVWAALTLVRAWMAAGRPAGLGLLGMFEAWVEVVGGILDVAGVPGLLANAKEFRQTATDQTAEWTEFLAAWWQRHGPSRVGIAELFALASGQKLLDTVLGDKGERSQRTRLGKAMGKVADRVFGNRRVERAGTDHSDRQMYQLVEVEVTVRPAAAPPSLDVETGEWSG